MVYNERKLIEALLKLEAKFNFKVLFFEEIIYNVKDNLIYHQAEGPPVDLDLYNHYSNSALVGAIFYWIETGFQLTPEELSIELTKISKNPPFKYTYKG